MRRSLLIGALAIAIALPIRVVGQTTKIDSVVTAFHERRFCSW